MSKHSCLAVCFKDLNVRLPKIEVLLVLQPTTEEDEKEGWHWSLPGGKCCHDKLKEGDCCPETAKETVIRECREETGYFMTILELRSTKDGFTSRTRKKFKRYVFIVEIASGQPLRKKVFSRETPKWFPLRSLPRNLFPSHYVIILEMVKRSLPELGRNRFSI